MDKALVNPVFNKIAYFHFLAGGDDTSQTARMPLKKGEMVSPQEKGLLEQYFLSLLSDKKARVSIGIISNNTLTVSFSGFTKNEFNDIENILKEMIQK
ncbi:MAG: hypothetical protein GF365_00220 [Candidatus Buchananbacteria bacterium]|nr:hypothetical protein [Candidatus Buchananbacteria bacterium]